MLGMLRDVMSLQDVPEFQFIMSNTVNGHRIKEAVGKSKGKERLPAERPQVIVIIVTHADGVHVQEEDVLGILGQS